jgi:hypothetical protein
MGQNDEPAQPEKPLAENEAENANHHLRLKMTKGVIGSIVLLVAVIIAVIAVSVACSPVGGGGADLPGGY